MTKSSHPQHRLVSDAEAAGLASPSSPRPICVLGMHRSGTSLVTGLLRMCGVELGPPEKIMVPKPDNPSGFWEHLDIHEINEHLLARLGGSWDRPLARGSGWENSRDIEAFYHKAREVVRRDFAAAPLWAFKDPRTAVLLPFWKRVVPGPRFVICVRNPLDVAKSLGHRNGLSLGAASRLWTQYTAAALFHTKSEDRILTLPENYFPNWRQELSRLQRFLGLSEDQVEGAVAELEAFIDHEKWHHRSNASTVFSAPELDPASKLLYSAVLQATHSWQGPSAKLRPASSLGKSEGLDLLSELVWHDLAVSTDLRQAGARKDSELARLRAEKDSELQQLRHEKDDELHQLRVRKDAELVGLRAEKDSELQQLRAEKDAQLAQTRDRLYEHMTLAANLETQLVQRRQDAERLTLEVARLKASLEDLRTRLHAVTSSLGWQLLDRYRDLRQRVFSARRLPERFYRRLTGGFRRRLATPHSEASPVPGRRHDADPSLEAADLKVFEEPPLLAPTEFDPPAAWLEDPRRPPVVVIIPNWNRVGYLRQCLTSLLEETLYPHYRICVVDQDSKDGSREYLESLGDRVQVIDSPRNLGFVHANNVALRSFPKWDVVFLNNDTRVIRGWLSHLVTTAYSSEHIGLVGSKLVYPDGRLQEAGSQVFRDGSARAFGKFEDQGDPRFNQRREVDYCSASCLFVKRQVLERCGGFEDCYSPCYYEDADLAFKARAAGYKVLYEPSSAVVHQEYGTSGKSSAFSWMKRNQERFVERWSQVLDNHPRSLWEAPGTGREKLLVVGDIVPAPDRSAGGSRLFYLLRILAREYDVVYAFLKDQMIGEYLRPLERIGVHTFYPGYARSVGSYELDVDSILTSNSFRHVVCSLYSVGAQYLGLIRERSPESTLWIDTYDVHFLREERQAELEDDPHLRRAAAGTKEVELATYARADAVITVTEDDKAALLREEPDLRVTIIPTLHEVPDRLAPREGRRDLLFVGGFSHQPNTDAVLYFCREVFPRLRRRIPDLRFFVVGNSPSPEVLALNGDGVEVTGYVPNLRPYLESCLVSVAPIRFGSGMKGKIADAMAYGLPVVTTEIGAEGMDLRPGVDVLLARSTAEFVDNVMALHEDDELWWRVARNAQARVRRDWTPEAVEPKVLDFFRRA